MQNWILWNRTVYMYKMDLELNNLQWLICHKTKPNQKPLSFRLTNLKANFFTVKWFYFVVNRNSKVHNFASSVFLLIIIRSGCLAEIRLKCQNPIGVYVCHSPGQMLGFANTICLYGIIIIIIIIISCKFFTLMFADCLSLVSEWQQISLCLQDYSQYSVRSYQCCILDDHGSSSDF